MEIQIFSEELIDELAQKSEEERNRVLFLEEHPEYPTHFLVNSFDPLFAHKLKESIGPYRAISIFKLDQIETLASNEGYERLVFIQDPAKMVERISNLDDPYPFSLGDIELKPFQLKGFNYLKNNLSDIVNWSTGTGKSVYAIAKAKYLLEKGLVERVVVASRNHNKINWQRSFHEIGDLESTIVDSSSSTTESRRAERKEQYFNDRILILNYEKFRERGKPLKNQKRTPSGDGEELIKALKGKKVFFIWDEMPTKLKNPSTTVYKGAIKAVRATKIAYQSMLSATPLENAPEDIYACVKILSVKLDRKPFTNLTNFRASYAKTMNPWAKWQVASWDLEKLQEMGMRLAHMTHQADKYRDPEIRAQFPKESWEDIIIDMSAEDKKLYNTVQTKINETFDIQDEIFSKLLVLQLICNNPATLHDSNSALAQAILEKYTLTDKHCAKLETLHDLLDQITGKSIIFSMYNDLGAKMIAQHVGDWGFSYVLFDGKAAQKQEAIDRFKDDRRIKLFISSDQGSDSINLEQATSVINYDLPLKHSTLIQRVNRINRITSEAEHIFYYNLIMANTVEERKVKLLTKKRLLQEAIFNGEIADQSEAMTSLTREDLIYLMTGEV